MSPHDFRRIILAHSLFVPDSRKPFSEAERNRPDEDAPEAAQKRIPEEVAQQDNG
jgi:hypothetical protein